MSELPPDSIERVDSGAGSVTVGSDGLIAREVELKWLINSMDGYTAAEAKGRDLAPIIYDGHRRSSLTCRPAGGGWYEIAATYGNTGIASYEGWGITNGDGVVVIPNSISVDTTGGTEHVTQAWSDSEDAAAYAIGYAAAGTAPESYGAINISGNSVNGVDITVPAFNWTETWLIPAWYLFSGVEKPKTQDGEINPATQVPYAKVLHNLTGCVCSDRFRTFMPGEVLFLGARYETSRAASMVPVTFSFSARPNREQFNVGPVTVDIKPGWDYMWVSYEDDVQDDTPVKRPKYVYVDRVYPRARFSELQIGFNWAQLYMSIGETFQHPLRANKANQA